MTVSVLFSSVSFDYSIARPVGKGMMTRTIKKCSLILFENDEELILRRFNSVIWKSMARVKVDSVRDGVYYTTCIGWR